MGSEVEEFFDAYAASFKEGPAAIAELYSEPCVTARMGVVRVNLSRSDTIAIFAEVDKQYRAQGYTHADRIALESKPLGANSVLATVRWAYKSSADITIWETTFSYNLYRHDGALRILLQTMHDE